MSSLPKVNTYAKSIKLLHWLTAVLLVLMLIGGFIVEDIPKAIRGTFMMFHKSTGILILFLMLFRFFWVKHKGKPALPNTVAVWERHLAHTVQYLLYFFVIAMPFVGWAMSMAANKTPIFFGLFALPLPFVPQSAELSSRLFEWHETIAWILIGLIALHVAGALKHHFITKDDVLKRML